MPDGKGNFNYIGEGPIKSEEHTCEITIISTLSAASIAASIKETTDQTAE